MILQWLAVFYRRFFSQQFKRSSMPDGPKVGSVALSPRGDWRMPSDASSAEWLHAVAELEAGVEAEPNAEPPAEQNGAARAGTPAAKRKTAPA